jgi:bacillithiol system protein YtxJ
MATLHDLKNQSDWDILWTGLKSKNHAFALVLKFSPRCPISLLVERICRKYVQHLPENPRLHIAAADVVNARPLSQQIAADTAVRHESPQAILIAPEQKVLWHASHEAIDEETLEEALKLVVQ